MRSWLALWNIRRIADAHLSLIDINTPDDPATLEAGYDQAEVPRD